jgi:predicted flap endonuclease-1-like 5' DNA nuclease
MTSILPEGSASTAFPGFSMLSAPGDLPDTALAFWRESLTLQGRMAAAAMDFWLMPFRLIAPGDTGAGLPVPAVAPFAAPLAAAAPVETVAPVAPPAPTPVVEVAAAAAQPDSEPDAPELFATPKGMPDDLTRIKGVGPKLAATLNEAGVWHYSQIAGWTPGEANWINDRIGFGGRVQREGWQAQARALAGA